MGIFIKGVGNVSPQKTIDKHIFESEDLLPISSNRLKCIEPDYTQFVDSKQLRRMSRVIRMGVAASFTALKEANIEKPDAVIVGTALGCLEDTASFLSKLVQNNEEMLSPTAFIYSTHNTIAAQIAYLLNCKGYNSTYVHKNISFESALIDAILLLNEKSVANVLVGGIDEITNDSFTILERLGHYKKSEEVANNLLFDLKTKGSIAGEGSAFFTLVDTVSDDCYAEILEVETLSFGNKDEVIAKAKQLLSKNNITNPDLLIAGYNGDNHDDKITDEVVTTLGLAENTLNFKQLSGEFGTASGFATWLAAVILKNKTIPQNIVAPSKAPSKIENILIYSHYQNVHHSLILLKAC